MGHFCLVNEPGLDAANPSFASLGRAHRGDRSRRLDAELLAGPPQPSADQLGFFG